jgi:hypothetical protein
VKIRFGNVLLTAVAAGFGLITLLGYVIPTEPNLSGLRALLLGWASVLAALAVWAGAFNLLRVHFRKMTSAAPGGIYSLFVVLGFLLAFAAALLPRLLDPAQALTGTLRDFDRLIFEHVISAGMAALAAMLAFFLVYAGYRVLRRRPTVLSVTFVIFTVLGLLTISPVMAGLPDLGFGEMLIAFTQLPAIAGARGLLIGIALGIIATSVRVLMALDRPYGD